MKVHHSRVRERRLDYIYKYLDTVCICAANRHPSQLNKDKAKQEGEEDDHDDDDAFMIKGGRLGQD